MLPKKAKASVKVSYNVFNKISACGTTSGTKRPMVKYIKHLIQNFS